MPKFRSQVDAPIELVIAVIILIASLSIALLIFGNTSKQQCFSQLKGEVQKLQLAMQDLALQSPPSTRRVYFSMPVCGDASVDVLRFVHYSRPEYCRACPGHYAGCWKLELATFNQNSEIFEQSSELYNSGVCVDVAGDMVLDDSSSSDPECEQLSNTPCPLSVQGEIINPTECTFEKSGVLKGVFDLNNVSSPSRWQTLGRETRTYDITLRKGIATCPLGIGASCPAISICARKVEG